jgi:FAD synthase
MGYPTANLGFLTSEKAIKNGVYGVKGLIKEQKEYLNVKNAGVKLTFNDPHQTKSFEIYILDFNKSIYDWSRTLVTLVVR